MRYLDCFIQCRCRMLAGILALALLTLAGCGGRGPYPVEGKIVVKDDPFPIKELEGYTVMFQSQTEPVVSASGTVKADGTFQVGTNKEDDGAVVGKHRVAVMPPIPEEGQRPKKHLLERYHRFETSGLEVTVEPKKNQIILEVEAARR
ncbi:MAG TPA: hypothetical protein VNK04_24040 [Gemmataceae bacterium]|nr:hypothetical protein [Gemmataceae bacterium]